MKTIQGLIFLAGFLLFLTGELIHPYRAPTVAKAERLVINILLTVLNSALIYLLFSVPTADTALFVTENRVGLLHSLNLPPWSHFFLTLILMDFTLYLWHLLNHIVPLLWRFHRVHHSDLNMDVSTASRFHAGELLISGVIKIGIIYSLGAHPAGLAVFESLVVLTAQFHHSSLKVPEWFEKIYRLFFVPPSMHRIHHSVKIRERNRNYGTIFSLWDRILGTFLSGIDQDKIVIGIGVYRNPQQLSLSYLLRMPFTPPVA